MGFSGSEDVIRCLADEELAGILEDRFITVGLDFATVLSSVPAPSSPFCLGSLSSLNSLRSK